MGSIPSSRTCTSQARTLGEEVRREFVDLRAKYRGEGLSRQEANERSYVEMHIRERWMEQKQRANAQEAMGSLVPLTPAEASTVLPGYGSLRVPRAEEIGEQEMALSEQVKWAMKWAAKVQNGAEPPVRFPCEGALFWYQSACQNRREFEKLLLRVEAPGGDPDNLYLQDSQYQYGEIERQVRSALREVGARLRELEKETLDGETTEGPGETTEGPEARQ